MPTRRIAPTDAATGSSFGSPPSWARTFNFAADASGRVRIPEVG